ncbi:hypothetical protein P3S67_016311 [Capsicum chacoense]
MLYLAQYLKMIIAEKFIQHIVVFDIFLTIFISSSEVGDGKIKCVAIEKEALLRLKEEFLDIHGRLSSCGNEAYNEDCCGWRGVQCDNQTGNVIRLGPHPVTVHIFLLSHCKISGGIPDFVASLSKLEYLNLSRFGYDFTTIFPHIGNFSSLNTLALSYITFPYVNSLIWLSNLRQLRYLAMGHVHLPNATDWLQSVLKLPFLQVLILPGYKLSLPIPSVAPSSNLLMSLTTLDFSSNNLNNSIYTLLDNLAVCVGSWAFVPSYADKM